MSGAREAILARLRKARGGTKQEDEEARAAVAARLAAPPRGLRPARLDLDAAGLVALFEEKAAAVDATLDHVADETEVPAAIASYLRGRNFGLEAAVAPHPGLDRLDWKAAAMTVRRGPPGPEAAVGINRPLCAVAETGTLVFASGPESPATLSFLPETHIAVLYRSEIVAAYEDAFDLLRGQGRWRDGALPRTVNLVTGTSRTGDIEQTLQKGVHGPKHLHIVVVKDG